MPRLLASLYLLSVLPAALAEDAAPKPLTVIDLRPKEEKDGIALTALEGKCNKNVFRIADVASDPLKLAVLEDNLSQMLNEGGDGRTLTVLNWSIYYNRQVQSKGGGLSSIGVQGYSLPGKKKERRAGSICARKESAGGWYEGSEIHSVYFPLVSEFEGTFGGKAVSARIVHSPRNRIAGEFQGGADDTQELLDTVQETALAVAEAIGNQSPGRAARE